ncbi:uncharacterized protein C22orf15 homolog [Bombina bombina]|uniref:uncharacterized protein C22orf15 homolog n=1 Tax=Bombina bombina TaxID=8345 RepID=UPI00235A6FBB|nr:uncharacterized protein C22orf15 homolog [Bombina bombina]
MFVTVKFGADQQLILNPNCKVVNLAEILREKCQCGPEVSIDLLDELGNLVNLSDLEGSQDNATNYLKERHRYILVRIIRGEGSETARYESMLDNLGKRHPDLAERLQKLSHPHLREKWRNTTQKKVRQPKETFFPSPTKIRAMSQQKSRPS